MTLEPELFSTAIKLLVSLVIVLGIGLLAYYGMRKLMNNNGLMANEKLIKVISNSYIGVKKSISLVEIPGAILVLGVTNDRINLLTTIEDPALIEGIIKDEGKKSVIPFAEHLQKLTFRYKSEKTQVAGK